MKYHLYKKKKEIPSPDNLQKYIKVTTPRVWAIVILSLLLLIMMVVWSVTCTIEIETEDGIKNVYPITYVTN